MQLTELFLNGKFINFTTKLEAHKIKKPTTFSYLFNNNLTTFKNMFKDCNQISEINFKNVNVEKISSMESMFQGCSKLTKVNFDNYEKLSPNDISFLFKGCYNLKEFDSSQLDLAKVEDSKHIFDDCFSIKSLNLTYFNSELVLNSIDFCTMNSLMNITVSKELFDKIKEMFEECLETYGYLLILCSAVELLFQCIAAQNNERKIGAHS